MTSSVFWSHWARLSRPPANLAPERRRSYQIFFHIYFFSTATHLFFIPMFLAIGMPLLTALNLACIVANFTAVFLHRRGEHAQALLLKLTTASALLIVAGMVLGGGTGCEYYFFIILFEVLISDFSKRIKLVLSVLLLGVVLSTIHVLFGTLGHWPFDELARELLLSVNMLTAFVLFTYIVLQAYAITETNERRFRTDATHDSLTGVLNRRAIFERAEAIWQENQPFALLLLDADHFKQINDNHGHSAGDEVLRHLANVLDGALRDGDCIGRVGGEEFLLMLPDASREDALRIATRLRNELAIRPCRLESLPLTVTVSMGLALSSEARQLRDVVDLADRRLYMAKSSGRDRLVSKGGEMPSANMGEGVTARLLSGAPSSDNTRSG